MEDGIEYKLREEQKDLLFKRLYFTNEEIQDKRSEILNTMDTGEVTLSVFKRSYRAILNMQLLFGIVEFYSVLASDNKENLADFIKKCRKYSYQKSFYGIKYLFLYMVWMILYLSRGEFMDLSIWWSYVIACIAIIVSPGPSVTYLVTTSMTYGRKAAFRIIPGIFAGDLSAMVLSSVGMAAIFQASEYAYNLIRLFGIAYLVYLGIRTWMSSINKNEHISSGTWISGFLMTFLNPKTIIFFLHHLCHNL